MFRNPLLISGSLIGEGNLITATNIEEFAQSDRSNAPEFTQDLALTEALPRSPWVDSLMNAVLVLKAHATAMIQHEKSCI